MDRSGASAQPPRSWPEMPVSPMVVRRPLRSRAAARALPRRWAITRRRSHCKSSLSHQITGPGLLHRSATMLARRSVSFRVYVANTGSNTVSVIDTATNQVVGSPITVGAHPFAFGQFIQPLILAGKPGSPNCHGNSVSALAQKFGGLAHAADTLGFASVSALQDTINRFCGG